MMVQESIEKPIKQNPDHEQVKMMRYWLKEYEPGTFNLIV
jgi:hypothetical protein